MTKKKVYVYSCDFCKKKGRSASHMRAHEKSCCRNPNRVCFLCKEAPDVPALSKAYEESVATLRLAASGCPACMLSGILQGSPDEDNYEAWDYSKELEDWRAEEDNERVMLG